MSKLSWFRLDKSQPLAVKKTVGVFAFLESIASEYPGRIWSEIDTDDWWDFD